MSDESRSTSFLSDEVHRLSAEVNRLTAENGNLRAALADLDRRSRVASVEQAEPAGDDVDDEPPIPLELVDGVCDARLFLDHTNDGRASNHAENVPPADSSAG